MESLPKDVLNDAIFDEESDGTVVVKDIDMFDNPAKSVDVVDTVTSIVESVHNQTVSNSENEHSNYGSERSTTITSKLAIMSYTDRINDLTKKFPNPEYEHFETYAYALYCKDCRMVLQPKSLHRIPCKVPECIVRQDGTVIYVHAKSEKLNLTEYIRSTANKCGNWKETYLRLWSVCHFLSCVTCKCPYPVRNSAMCSYHPQNPKFYPIGNLSLEQPIGVYPCCGERAFRFQVIENPFGCKYRMHEPCMNNAFDMRIVSMMRKYPELTVAELPPSITNHETKTKLSSYQHWWVKLTLGENRLTHSAIMSSVWKLINPDKKLKRLNDLNKWGKKYLFELHKVTALHYKHAKLNNNISNSKNEDTRRTPSNTELDPTNNSIDRDLMWKTLSPMITIQDLQREQESIIFSQIAIDRNKSSKDVNCVSKIFDPHKGTYTVIHANMLAKIDGQNKLMSTKHNRAIIKLPPSLHR